MKIRVTKTAHWNTDGKDKLRKFVEGEILEVAQHVSDAIAQNMLEHGYAVPAETKETVVKETKAKSTKKPAAKKPETGEEENDA